MRTRYNPLHNPSVKIASGEPILTAPFTQGSLWSAAAPQQLSKYSSKKESQHLRSFFSTISFYSHGMMLSQGKQSKQSKGFPDNMRVWWNGRHAGLRTQGETHAGSKPVTRTIRCGFESHHAYQKPGLSHKKCAAVPVFSTFYLTV